MRLRHYFVFVLIAAAMLVSPFRISAQTTELELINKANQLFEVPDYPAAMPLYSQLLAIHPEDPNYNYRYGVCVLFASSEKDKALKYLETASKNPGVDPDVWFYLGKAYHLNYQFEQAIAAYNKYKALAGPKKSEKLQVDNQIAMCKTGRKLLKAITDITVLEKAELNETDFFKHYDLKDAGYSGQLLVKPDEFKTALDKKKKEQSIIYLSGEKNELYFSSYGTDESQGKDIYRVRKLPDGTWGKPYNLGYPINTEYDEDYPFMHPNGKVLYFSSKGHNSMGGYDIFRAELNEETSTFEKPVNLDFAINSPDDDIMFVSDLEEKTAWFASSRSSPDGKMMVYHVQIERKPVNMCLIAGNYIPTNNDPNRSAKITVKNSETNEPIGVFKSNETTGKYFMNLPNNGGKYTFTVDHGGIATQTETVIIPPQYSIKTINQQIGYNDQNNESKLYIRTDFEADSSMLDPTFLKDKAKLDINGNDVQMQVVDLDDPATHTTPTIKDSDNVVADNTDDDSAAVDPLTNVPSSNGKVSNDELIKSAYDDANSTQQDASSLTQQANRAYAYAQDLNKQAKEKTDLAKKAKADADAMPDGPDKVAAEQKANALMGDANALQAQTVAATAVAEALDHDAQHKTDEAKKAQDYATSLDKAVKSNDSKALDHAQAVGADLAAMSDTRPENTETVKNLQDVANKKQQDLDKAKTQTQDLRDEIAANQTRIQQLKDQAAKEKDKDIRDGINSQIETINDDIADDQKLLATAEANQQRLQNEANDADNQAKAASDAVAQSKNPSIAPTPIDPTAKKALSADVLVYQQNISETGTALVFAPIDKNAGTNPVANNNGGTQNNGGTNPVANNNGGTQNNGGTNPVTDNNGGTQNNGGTTPVTDNNGGTNPVTDNNGGTQNNGGTNPDDSNVVVENYNPDLPYTNALTDADTISNDVARNNAKADIYKNWASSIDDQIKDKKQELAGTKDKTKKDQLNKEIKDLQAQKTQENNNSKQALADAAKAQKTQDAQAGVTPVPQPLATTDANFQKQLDAASQQPAGAAQENAKAQVYNDWADTLDAQADAKSAVLLKTKNKKDQDKLKADIADLHNRATEKRNLADEAKNNAIASAQNGGTQNNGGTNPVANNNGGTQNNGGTNPVTNNNGGTQNNGGTNPVTDNNGGAQNSVTPFVSPEGIKYDNSASVNSLNDKQVLVDQAQQLRNKQDSLTQLAGTKNGAERNKLLSDATEAQRQSWKKDADASAKQGEANNEQFIANNQKLQSYSDGAKGSADPAIVTATDLNTEAQNLFAIAKQERDSAANTKDNFTKSNLLQNAEDNEQKGLKKQQDALLAYQQSGIQPVANSNGGTNPVANNNGGTQNNGGTNPVANNNGGTQNNGGTDPVTNNNGGTQNNGGTNPVANNGGTQNNGGTNPVANNNGGTQNNGETNPVSNNNGGTQNNGGTNPVSNNNGGTQNNGGTNPVANNNGGTQNNGGTNPVANNNGGTQNNGGTNPVTNNNGGTQNDGGTNPVANNNGANDKIIDPTTGQALTPIQIDQIRGTADYKNYVALNAAAIQADQNVIDQKAVADKYQDSANANIAKAQDLSVKAADENDPTKKQDLINQSKQYNALAKNNMASRDSVNELADDAASSAKIKHNQADFVLQGMNQNDAGQLKAVATADQKNNGGSSARMGGTNPVTDNNGGTQNNGGTNPVANNNGGTQNNGGTNPVANNNGGTQNNGGTNPVANNNGGTQNNGGTNPVANNNGGTQNNGGTNPVTNNNGGTQNNGGTNPVSNNNGGTQNNGGTNPVTNNNGGTQNNGGTNPVSNNNGGTNSSSVTSRLAPGEDFTLNAQAPAPTTIPVNPALPEGLVYKVQIGAFRNPISPEIYKGISPVTAETTTSGLTRYTAGFFTEFPNADAAKNEIRKMGYKDAFVVAFYNGKRISVDEAYRIANGGAAPANNNGGTQNNGGTSNNGGANPVVDNNGGAQNNGGTNPVVDNNGGTQNNGGSNLNSAPVDVKNVKGLFYTVQIGVYRTEVSNAKLKNLPEIVNDHLPNGLIRYSSGKYCSEAAASAAKNNAVAKGIPDAFVCAYYNGKRITPDEAKALEAQGVSPCSNGEVQTAPTTNNNEPVDNGNNSRATNDGISTPANNNNGGTQNNENTIPDNNGGSQTNRGTTPVSDNNAGTQNNSATNQVTDNNGGSQNNGGTPPQNPVVDQPVVASTQPPVPDTGIVFSVQIGAFKEEVPVDIANKFLQLSSKGVKNYLDQTTGLTVYQVGVLMTKDEADALRGEAISKGISDAFVVAFKDGKKITVEEALKLLGE